MRRGERTELLLMDWDFLPPLEPQGATAEEALVASSLYWWDALADRFWIREAGLAPGPRSACADSVASCNGPPGAGG